MKNPKQTKFKIEDYKEQIRNFDTNKCHISVNGKTGIVTVKPIKIKRLCLI